VDPLKLEFSVACSPEHAFDIWANKTSLWWPADHSVSADPELVVTIEPRSGGRIFERTSEGAEHDWGEVVVWEPPRRLAYLWHIGRDRGYATNVEITFTGDAGATTVTIVHSGWDRLGDEASEMKRRNDLGWSSLIPHYERACVDLTS
jgi:uncharacterized protein YndB with AHSA1/START domain